MSFKSAAATFAAQAAAHRADAFAGDVDADGYNLQIGATKFTAAFERNGTEYELRHHGKTVRCNASFMLPDSVGVTVNEDTLVTHLPTGHVYEVVRIREETGFAAERSVLLFRQED
jgi:hypothetical protein